MPVSDILQIPVLTEAMAQKTIGVNMAIQSFEKALAGKLDIVTTAATTSGFDVVIPFNTTNDLSAREALRAIYYELLAGATQEFDVIHPNNPHLFLIKNSTTQIATLRTVVGGSTANVPPGSTYLIYCDGEDMTKMDFTLNTLTQASDYSASFWGKPDTSQVMARFLVGRTTDFPANFSGSRGRVGANPVTTRTFDVMDDATQIGTISVSAAGAVTFATSGGTAKIVAAGSVLTIVNQSGAPDTIMTDIEIVLLGTVEVAQPVP